MFVDIIAMLVYIVINLKLQLGYVASLCARPYLQSPL